MLIHKCVVIIQSYLLDKYRGYAHNLGQIRDLKIVV